MCAFKNFHLHLSTAEDKGVYFTHIWIRNKPRNNTDDEI